MHKYLTPSKILKYINILLKPISIFTILCLSSGLYFALIKSPPDYQQGEIVRIMYVHVPAAWMALGIYVFISFMSAAFLIWKSPVSSIMASQSAMIGAAFTAICLITGSIWGKPTWGTWWVWDARLTSMLILLFLYIGYMVLLDSYDNKEQANKISAIFALIGLVNIPIIKFSVEWWNTLHQPASIIRSGGIAIDPSMLTPLLLMFAGFAGFFAIILFLKVKTRLM